MVNFSNHEKVNLMAGTACLSQIKLIDADPKYGFEVNTSNSESNNQLIGL